MEYYLLLSLLIIQRLNEVKRGQINLNQIQNQLVFPVNQSEKKQMFILHSVWFISCFLEFLYHGELASPMIFVIFTLILVLCQIVRYQTMSSLGKAWTTVPVAFKNQKIVSSGLYKMIKHPNYLVVMVEIAIVPLMGQAYWTAILFSLINFLFLYRRIHIEELALAQLPEYERIKMKKKIIPYIFTLLLVPGLKAETMIIDHPTYAEARSGINYFKFSGISKKLGLITTSFDGFAKKCELTYDIKENTIRNIVLKIDANQIDTNNSFRDQKLKDTSLKSDSYNHIIIKVEGISLSEKEQMATASMSVRGNEYPIQIQIRKTDENKFRGTAKLKLSEMGIPDPSIAIAKVNDNIEVEFQIKI